ncbi:restriction endonuclease subunit S [Laribacter hongkongensis]|uniref:Restriction modification system, type I n=1 Tax=Laribacter hongkongensis TaxID=168471 RepID=A0A248LIH0_9NEIS|nr:restriction endonuclease subunit S [Laribacter hongkongensis]ASJ24281.1 restriction modification system, type I [Laribacter hongkongensis]MCG9110700.1 restriction endonuclease subunit S [Laribacter hongkongensis]MCG9122578.1 restriction endonuclease subunit S [Laribacter hongkongensis]
MKNEFLKPGWRRVRFGDVVRLSKARSQDPLADGIERYVGLEHLEPGDLRIRSWGSVADGVTFTSVFQPGQVLFGKRRAYQRKVAVADFSGVCSGDIYVLETKDSLVLLPELLPFICQTDAFFDHAVGTSAGSLSPRTNWTSLADFEFVLPPIDEQQSAIALLSAATDQCHAIEAAHRAAGRMLQSFKDSLLLNKTSSLANSYLLGDLLLRSPESGCSAPPKDADTGYFVLGLAALSRDGYVSGDFKPVEPTSKMVAAKLSMGDMLISRSNTVERVGFVGIFSDNRDDVSFPDTMMRLQPNPALVHPDFLEALLQTTSAREFLMRIAAGTSASMKKINRANLLQMRLNVPDLDAQELALDELQKFKNAIATQKARWDAARQLTRLIAMRTIGGAA